MPSSSPAIQDLISALRRQLAEHPAMEDSVEGFRAVLRKQRFDPSLTDVEAALESLLSRGELERLPAGNRVHYRRPIQHQQ